MKSRPEHPGVYPGGHQDRIVYRQAFGTGPGAPGAAHEGGHGLRYRFLDQGVATTPAIMQLVDKGRLRLMTPWPLLAGIRR